MHTEVLNWVGQFSSDEELAVLDIGGRDLNGSTRVLFRNAKPYHVLDLREGPNVDIVADAADPAQVFAYISPGTYDLVLCTETFEHAKGWRDILATAYEVLRPGGWLVFTCAGPGRPPHSGVAAQWELIGGEWYANVSPEEVSEVLHVQGWTDIEVRQLGTDTQGKAIKPDGPREVLLGATLSRTA